MEIVVETERLILRPWQSGELEDLRAIIGDPATMLPWPAPLTEAQIESWLVNAISDWATERLGRWAIQRKSDSALIGDCGLRRTRLPGHDFTDLGYILHTRYQGQGYGLKAARAALDYGEAILGLTDIACHMAEDNLPSRHVAEKLGLVEIRRFIHPGNRNKTHIVYMRPDGIETRS